MTASASHADASVHAPPCGSTALAELMLQYRDRPFLLIEPGGNFGDSLIYAGMHRLADRLGISYRSVTHRQLKTTEWSAETILYMHGGGGFVPFWSGTPGQCLRYIASRHSGVLIIGPTTYSSDPQYLEEFLVQPLADAKLQRAFLFCRELPSYEAVVPAVGELAEVRVDHDTAFNLKASDLEAMAGEQVGQQRGYDLYAIRKDVEKVDVGRAPLMAMPIDPVRYCDSFQGWLCLHIRARKVVTNRLHSAIAAAILGKPTRLLPNNYHKARGVYEYSLEQFGVVWSDRLDESWQSRTFGRTFDYLLKKQPWVKKLAWRLRYGASV